MSTNRTFLWCVALIALGAVLWYRTQVFPGDKEITTTRVLFITGGSDPFWQLTARGARAAAEEHDAELTIEMPSQDEGLATQMQMLVRVDPEETDGVAISPLDAEGQTRLINLLAQRTNVVTFDSDAPISNRHYYIGTSNYAAGKLCYELVKEALPEGGKTAVLISNLTKNNMIERKVGFDEGIGQDSSEESPFTVVEYLVDNGEREVCLANIETVLKDHPDLDCIVGMNGYHGPLLVSSIPKKGDQESLKLIAFDEAEETLKGIEEGIIFATIAQNPYKYGYDAVRMLTELKLGDKDNLPIVGGGEINIPCVAIRKENLAEFRKNLADRLGETATPKAGE